VPCVQRYNAYVLCFLVTWVYTTSPGGGGADCMARSSAIVVLPWLRHDIFQLHIPLSPWQILLRISPCPPDFRSVSFNAVGSQPALSGVAPAFRHPGRLLWSLASGLALCAGFQLNPVWGVWPMECLSLHFFACRELLFRAGDVWDTRAGRHSLILVPQIYRQNPFLRRSPPLEGLFLKRPRYCPLFSRG